MRTLHGSGVATAVGGIPSFPPGHVLGSGLAGGCAGTVPSDINTPKAVPELERVATQVLNLNTRLAEVLQRMRNLGDRLYGNSGGAAEEKTAMERAGEIGLLYTHLSIGHSLVANIEEQLSRLETL